MIYDVYFSIIYIVHTLQLISVLFYSSIYSSNTLPRPHFSLSPHEVKTASILRRVIMYLGYVVDEKF